MKEIGDFIHYQLFNPPLLGDSQRSHIRGLSNKFRNDLVNVLQGIRNITIGIISKSYDILYSIIKWTRDFLFLWRSVLKQFNCINILVTKNNNEYRIALKISNPL